MYFCVFREISARYAKKQIIGNKDFLNNTAGNESLIFLHAKTTEHFPYLVDLKI